MNFPVKFFFPFWVLWTVLFSSIPLYAGDTAVPDSETKSNSEKSFNDLDSLFDQAADISSDQAKTDTASQAISQALTALVTYPVKFSGSLDAQLGTAYFPKEGTHSGYYNFINHLYFSARPVNEVTINADIKTSFDNAFTWRVYQMYFDYTLWDRAVITAGKKVTTWGNTKIFDSEADFLSDSYKSVSALLSIPLGSASFTGAALYSLSNITATDTKDSSSYDTDDSSTIELSGSETSYAGQFSFLMGQTSVNLLCRKYPASSSTKPLFGMELKRTVFGFDIYGHGQVNIHPGTTMKSDNVQSYRFIGGFYRKWDAIPSLGINTEYYYNKDMNSDTVTQKIGATAGLSKLCNNKLALAVTWNHNLSAKTGDVTPGFIITNVFPSANLDTGVKFSYGANAADSSKPWLDVSAGIKLVLSVNY